MNLCNNLLHKFRGVITLFCWIRSQITQNACGMQRKAGKTAGRETFWCIRSRVTYISGRRWLKRHKRSRLRGLDREPYRRNRNRQPTGTHGWLAAPQRCEKWRFPTRDHCVEYSAPQRLKPLRVFFIVERAQILQNSTENCKICAFSILSESTSQRRQFPTNRKIQDRLNTDRTCAGQSSCHLPAPLRF